MHGDLDFRPIFNAGSIPRHGKVLMICEGQQVHNVYIHE